MRVMTYNILDGGVGREHLITEVTEAVRPDVLVLQEVYQNGFVERLAGDLAMQHALATGNSTRHMALLSRLPIRTAAAYHPKPPIQHVALEAELEHPQLGSIWLFGVHLLPMLSIVREAWRTWEISAVLRHIGDRRRGPCLVAGDFNTVARDDSVVADPAPSLRRRLRWFQSRRVFRIAVGRMQAAGFHDCYRHLHPGLHGYTLPAPDPGVRLDYIFASPPLAARLTHCTVVTDPPAVRQASDHLPVAAEFTLADFGSG